MIRQKGDVENRLSTRFAPVARSVIRALSQPEHVAVNEVLVEPRDEPV